MTSVEAVEWVGNHRRSISAQAANYIKFAPYEISDYLQDAYMAAIQSASICQSEPNKNFRAVFSVRFREIVSRVTPYADEAREKRRQEKKIKAQIDSFAQPAPSELSEESASSKYPALPKYWTANMSLSFPSNAQKYTALEHVKAPSRSARKVDIEKVFMEKARPFLSDREQQVMAFAIGITRDGALNDSEIANRLGMSRTSVLTYRMRAIKKLEKKYQPEK